MDDREIQLEILFELKAIWKLLKGQSKRKKEDSRKIDYVTHEVDKLVKGLLNSDDYY